MKTSLQADDDVADLPDMSRFLQPGQQWVELLRENGKRAHPWILGIVTGHGYTVVRQARFQSEQGRWVWSDAPKPVAVAFARALLAHFEETAA